MKTTLLKLLETNSTNLNNFSALFGRFVDGTGRTKRLECLNSEIIITEAKKSGHFIFSMGNKKVVVPQRSVRFTKEEYLTI